MEEKQTDFEDAESFGFNYLKDKISFRDICLQHLKKISQFASVEFRGGYWEEKPDPRPNSNMNINIYIPDTREIYYNAIECFADMLCPYFDKEMKEAEETSINENKKAYDDNTIIKEKVREDKNSEEAKKYEREFKDQWNRVSYRSERVKINRKLFRALCCFLYRKKYLELGSIED